MNTSINRIFQLLFERYPELSQINDDIYDAFTVIKKCYEKKGKVLVCGNGGSSADADHIVGELMKGFLLKREIDKKFSDRMVKLFGEEGLKISNSLQNSLPAISLSAHQALLTAFMNDVEPDCVFAQQVFGYAQKNDILIAISTSGNSANIINAIKVAKVLNLDVIGLSGRDGGKMNSLCDVNIIAPSVETYKTQEYHLPIYHTLCAMVEEHFFGIKNN